MAYTLEIHAINWAHDYFKHPVRAYGTSWSSLFEIYFQSYKHVLEHACTSSIHQWHSGWVQKKNGLSESVQGCSSKDSSDICSMGTVILKAGALSVNGDSEASSYGKFSARSAEVPSLTNTNMYISTTKTLTPLAEDLKLTTKSTLTLTLISPPTLV